MKRCLRIFSLIMVVIIAFSAFSISASAERLISITDMYYDMIIVDVDLSYEDEIKSCFYYEIFEGDTDLWHYYNMLYAHFNDSQTEPEYVVFIARTNTWNDEAEVHKFVGDCLIWNNTYSYPYDLAHYVYVPSLQKVYTLEEAYYSENLDISAAMRSGRVGIHRGDINFDRSCDILDATIIQMYLASLDIDKDIYIWTGRMDLDGSDDVSIIDATKLQRYLARLDDYLVIETSSVEA